MSLQEDPMPTGGKPKRNEETVTILRAAASASSTLAIRQAREHGLTVTVAVGNRIVKVAPNGATTELKVLAPSGAYLAKGSKVSYR
jgi:hypothetical protein